ncbi:MAG: 16S rRNA (cytosine(1402)-N(4))-methyltransferase RsmH [Flavobacteriales bacterium]|nr:16S rRNA (cytosine(1402)-N(4))-methyltransferase RsmH [Flavobacteriales bacterium]
MYHKPVLLTESVEMMQINPGGVYVDATFGGGGHSQEILNRLGSGRLIAFDQDKDAHVNSLSDERFKLVHSNFRFISNFLSAEGCGQVDGILADLGVSSYQFDKEERGFSYRFEASLDMRMNVSQSLDARKILMEYEEQELYRIFKEYSDIKNLGCLVNKILDVRAGRGFDTTLSFVEDIESCVPQKKQNQYLAQVFQALRIEVNDEVGALKELLVQCVDLLKKGGRLVVISYHSIEDRLVKRFINSGNFKNEIEKDFYGNIIRPFKSVNKKVIQPHSIEIQENNRSRSAKLRVAERI